ncbi:FAD-binding oxidoreductase [Brachybacterium sp. ACRRE]|uniref:FAD-binding oxidoreductase n=1 Tax=Brachybacterium sp. ACRRE TaxID=2918184 RepID=UPI001EF245BD|nr:FAD-binding oxidoreductase [Brachybacterium sp. ACRRE]MCG7310534.1 FAD-binding oxidoreductase [Brachybacterium sp. ACRRE]
MSQHDLVTDLRARHPEIALALPGEDMYARSLDLWNGGVTTRPAVIARPTSTDEVSSLVRLAREHDAPLAVRGGGHDWLGRSLAADGLTIELADLRDVRIEGTEAVVGGGALARDLVAESSPRGLLAATGTAGSVGLAGLSLAGGYGPLLGTAGLACDNIMGAEVVLADGTVTSTQEDPELLWALRGGGGNFGVVTSMRIALHRDPGIVGGTVLFPGSQAATVLDGCAELIARGTRGLTLLAELTHVPDVGPSVLVVAVWSGEPDGAGPALDAVRGLGTPLVEDVKPTTQQDLLAGFDQQVPHGMHWCMRARTVRALTPEVIQTLLAAAEDRPGPGAGIGMRQFHGAATDVPADATAFGRREEHVALEISAGWTDGEDPHPYVEWAEEVRRTLEPLALPGGYPNFLAPQFTDQVAASYGGHADRLRTAKARFDPDGVFTATPLPS